MADTMPAIRYARSGDVHVAYQVVGDGPVDIVFVEGFVTNRHVLWEEPSYRRFVERLGSFARVILFDKRGMGLSDRVQAGTLEERMDDVRAVMDAVGSERAALIGESEGGPMSMLFAAAHPERTRRAHPRRAEVKEDKTEDWPWGESTREEFEESMVGLPERWSECAFVAEDLRSESGDDPRVLEWFGRLKMQSASPAAAEVFMRMAHEIDVRDVVPTIRVPTLILHSVGDQICHVENARYLARTIPGARYVELPGADHVMYAELADLALAEIREFLTGVREGPEPERVLATVLFTDLVGSTERAAELGDRRWRELLERHHAAVRRELDALRRSRDRHGRRRLPRRLRRAGPGDPLRAAPSSTRSTGSGSRCGRASTRASARCSARSSPVSPCTSAPGWPRRPGRARCSSRARSAI